MGGTDSLWGATPLKRYCIHWCIHNLHFAPQWQNNTWAEINVWCKPCDKLLWTKKCTLQKLSNSMAGFQLNIVIYKWIILYFDYKLLLFTLLLSRIFQTGETCLNVYSRGTLPISEGLINSGEMYFINYVSLNIWYHQKYFMWTNYIWTGLYCMIYFYSLYFICFFSVQESSIFCSKINNLHFFSLSGYVCNTKKSFDEHEKEHTNIWKKATTNKNRFESFISSTKEANSSRSIWLQWRCTWESEGYFCFNVVKISIEWK